jgi:hypothetical protein
MNKYGKWRIRVQSHYLTHYLYTHVSSTNRLQYKVAELQYKVIAPDGWVSYWPSLESACEYILYCGKFRK